MKKLAAAIVLAIAFCHVASARDWSSTVCATKDGAFSCWEVEHFERFLPLVAR